MPDWLRYFFELQKSIYSAIALPASAISYRSGTDVSICAWFILFSLLRVEISFGAAGSLEKMKPALSNVVQI